LRIQFNRPELPESDALGPCFFLGVDGVRLDLDLAAHILSRQLVHIGADLGDLVRSIAPHSIPLALNGYRDPIAILSVSVQDASLVHGLISLRLKLEGVAVVAPGAQFRRSGLERLEDRARHGGATAAVCPPLVLLEEGSVVGALICGPRAHGVLAEDVAEELCHLCFGNG